MAFLLSNHHGGTQLLSSGKLLWLREYHHSVRNATERLEALIGQGGIQKHKSVPGFHNT